MAELTRPLPTRASLATSRRVVLLYGSLALALLFHLSINAYWISRNVVPIGRDAGGHLTRALQYAEILDPLTPQALFQAITLDNFRPPALYLAVQPFYRLFGLEMDHAQLLNLALLAVVLALTYALGTRLGGEELALFAVVIAGLFPMLAAMTRLFYAENFETAAILLVLLALLRGDGFSSRPWSLVWGAALGVGLLIKWAVLVYVFLPILVAVWRAGLLHSHVDALRRPRVDRRALALSGVGALLLAALWYLPNRAQALGLPLGDALLVIWVMLLLGALYALLRPPSRLTNFWAGSFIALALASLWYVARIDFIPRLLDAAYGSFGGNYDPFDPLRLRNYTRYLGYLWSNHLGLLGSLLLLAGLLGWLRRGHHWRASRPATWLLWSSVVSTYLLLSFASEDSARNLVPILPVLAILFAAGLRHYGRRPALALGSVAVLVLGLQLALYTFDRLGPLHERSAGLWASGEFLMRPASGRTDPGFWIAPGVLETIAARDTGRASLGILVDSAEIHFDPFRYLATVHGHAVEVNRLTERDSRGWGDVIANTWILLKDSGNKDVEAPGQAAIARILAGDALFELLYDEVARYPLPNGQNAILYHRPEGPSHPDADPRRLAATAPLAAAINSWSKPGTPLFFADRDLAVWIGIHDLRVDAVEWLPSDPASASLVGAFLVAMPAPAADTWARLESHAYHAADVRTEEGIVAVYGSANPVHLTSAGALTFGDVRLEASTYPAALCPGDVLPVELAASGPIAPNVKVSARLLAPQGETVAQNDKLLAPHTRMGLFLPPDRPAAAYTLAFLLYDAGTLAPLLTGEGRDLNHLVTLEPCTHQKP